MTGTLSDCGLTYHSTELSDITEQLYNYVMEMYGKHTVVNAKTEIVYSNCKMITSPGDYIIKCKHNDIYCSIR